MTNSHRERVRVLFLNCPRLDWMACSYLILAQNSIQDIFEFEVYSFWVYADHTQGERADLTSKLLRAWSESPLPFRRWALRHYAARLDVAVEPFLSSPLELEKSIELVTGALQRHDAWLGQLKRSYGGWSIRPAPTIAITETPFGGGYRAYYSWADKDKDLAIVTVANWQRYFAPPSVLEFILSTIQRYALYLVFYPAVGSHYPTRGCVWDFNANLEDARTGLLVGYLCSDCEGGLSRKTDAQGLQAIKTLLRNGWIGRTEEPGTVASNIKRIFSYDLARTRGLSPGFRDLLLEVATPEAIRWLIPFGLGALATWLLRRSTQGK